MGDPDTPFSTSRDISRSCTECRRRKAKCDRLYPKCTNCEKSRRTCSYERPSRTPLTRRYVTELEQELARAQELLRGSSTSQRPVQAQSLDLVYGNGAELSALDDMVARNNPPPSAPSLVRSATGTHSTQPSQALTLETSPASGDFDWDERNASNVDGMASMASASNRGGYLGVASGVALLRLADSEAQISSIDGVEQDQQGEESSQVPTPILKTIYSLSQLEPFVNAYFELYHVSYPIVNEATFRAQFMEIIPRPKHRAWHVLLYIIAALGAFTGAERQTEVDVALFQASKARLSIDMLETGNITFVQALTLISNYVQKRNKPNTGYNYTGLAKRVALGIGLHKEFPAWHANPLMLEIRRRVWWTLFVFDVGAGITFSRPLDSPDGGVEVSLPLNVHDTDITASTRHSPPEVNEVTLYSHVRCQSKFHLASGPIYARLLATPFPDAEELVGLDDLHISRFIAELPAYFNEDVQQPPKYRLCHAILKWRYRNFRILMYRAFVVRNMLKTHKIAGSNQVQETPNHFEILAMQRCLDAASETVDLITGFWKHERRSMMACWYSLYFLFQAILIPVICLRNEPQSFRASDWRDQIFRASEIIADMAGMNHAASRCHNIIMSLCGVYLSQSQDRWNEPVQESPQTQLNGLYPFMWPMLDGFQPDGYDSALHDSVMQDFMNQITGM